MSEKTVIVQGAICKCQFGVVPDRLKVLSHKKEYANDADGTKKLIVTTKEIGATTFENNSFGSCLKMGSPPPPCKIIVQEWVQYYEGIELSNGGYIIVEDSKAICAVAGAPCIEIIHHGQIAEPGMQNFKNADPELHGLINPLVDSRDMEKENRSHSGIQTK